MSAPGESDSSRQGTPDHGAASENIERVPTDPALHPDFDALVAQAFEAPAGNPEQTAPRTEPDEADADSEAPPISIENLDSLWSAFLKLEEWVFLVQPLPGRDPFPFIGRADDLLWFFLFTDHERLRRFADQRGLLDPELNAHFITMSPEQSLEWLARLRAAQHDDSAHTAVYGIRINEGPRGWYAPLESLPAIQGHLKELGRI